GRGLRLPPCSPHPLPRKRGRVGVGVWGRGLALRPEGRRGNYCGMIVRQLSEEKDMPERNRQIVLKRRPNGLPVPEDFAIAESPLPEPGEGEVVLRGLYLSVDPYMRGRISGVRSYARPTEIGEVIEGRVVGQVARSRDP